MDPLTTFRKWLEENDLHEVGPDDSDDEEEFPRYAVDISGDTFASITQDGEITISGEENNYVVTPEELFTLTVDDILDGWKPENKQDKQVKNVGDIVEVPPASEEITLWFKENPRTDHRDMRDAWKIYFSTRSTKSSNPLVVIGKPEKITTPEGTILAQPVMFYKTFVARNDGSFDEIPHRSRFRYWLPCL